MITAPIWASASRSVGPTLIFETTSTSRGSTVSAALPIAIAVEPAMHRSPAQPKAASRMPVEELVTSASGITSTKFFAPPAACTRLPLAVPIRWISRATGVEPTNDTALIVGWARIASTASRPPCTTLSTPAGSPACCAS